MLFRKFVICHDTEQQNNLLLRLVIECVNTNLQTLAMNDSTCLICNEIDSAFHNVFATISRHSKTPLVRFIERFTKINLKRSEINKTYKLCSQCVTELNKFDQCELICISIQEYLTKRYKDTVKLNRNLKNDWLESASSNIGYLNYSFDTEILDKSCVTKSTNDVLNIKIKEEVVDDVLMTEYEEPHMTTRLIIEDAPAEVEEVKIKEEYEIEEISQEDQPQLKVIEVPKTAFTEFPKDNSKVIEDDNISLFSSDDRESNEGSDVGMEGVEQKQDDGLVFHCPKCLRIYKHRRSLAAHFKNDCGKPLQYTCRSCGKMFHKSDSLKKHMVTHSGEQPMQCPTCPNTYVLQYSLEKHLKYQCGQAPRFHCRVCTKRFYRKHHLQSHMETHSTKEPLQCPTCSNTYKMESSLGNHLRYECGKEPQFHCQVCLTRFHRRENLKRHMVTHTNIGLLKCPTCTNTYKLESSLSAHLENECGREPKFHCEECPKKFHSKKNLTRHLVTHSSLGPLKCPKCPNTYKLESSLGNHLRYECGEEPQFHCEFCPKKYHMKYNLNSHMLTHSRKEPLKCPTCTNTYKIKSSLAKHLKNECGKEPQFNCEICSKQFHRKDSLKRHMVTHTD